MASTLFLLMAEFDTGDIPVEKVCEKYLGLSAAESRRRAARRDLPFPAYRPGSQKGQWLVRATDLAAYLDSQHDEAVREWEALHNVRKAG